MRITPAPAEGLGPRTRVEAADMQVVYASRSYPDIPVVTTSHLVLAATGHNLVQATVTSARFQGPTGPRTRHMLQSLTHAAVTAVLDAADAPPRG